MIVVKHYLNTNKLFVKMKRRETQVQDFDKLKDEDINLIDSNVNHDNFGKDTDQSQKHNSSPLISQPDAPEVAQEKKSILQEGIDFDHLTSKNTNLYAYCDDNSFFYGMIIGFKDIVSSFNYIYRKDHYKKKKREKYLEQKRLYYQRKQDVNKDYNIKITNPKYLHYYKLIDNSSQADIYIKNYGLSILFGLF